MSDFTARTDSMTARTTPMSQSREERTALATRSSSAIDRLSGDAKRAALRNHFDAFPPAIFSARARA